MAKPDLEREIDRLFHLSLSDFTQARNALASRVGGDDAARVRRLAKPNTAAWAVNQLYWRRRSEYSALVRAAEQLRAAHRRKLSGRAADLSQPEAAHRDALKAAMTAARELLREAGEAESAGTLSAIGETLQALPAGDQAGRLSRPLKPLGLEALAGLVPASRNLKLVSLRAREPPAPGPEPPQRERRRLTKELAAARTATRDAVRALETTRKALARVEQEHSETARRLEALSDQARRMRDRLSVEERSVERTRQDQTRLERFLEGE